MTQTHFVKDNGVKLPVDDKYLLPFLSPTSKGTQYWDRPPSVPEELHRRFGRIFLQVHQLLDLLLRAGIDLKDRRMLDIGTGNGMIPRLMLRYSALRAAVGSDRYLENTHKTSSPLYDRDRIFEDMCALIEQKCPGEFAFEKYAEMTKGHQHHSLKPGPVPYTVQAAKDFSFQQLGAHDLDKLEGKYDLIYCKAIDHISDWNRIFEAISAVAGEDAVVCIKHFSFFSYLGPHRYATTNIPWGHLLLTDDEYRRFAREFHAHRAEQMIDFYFNGLAYPRTPMSGLLQIALRHGFYTHTVINEPLRNTADVQPMTAAVPDFWKLLAANHPTASAEELFSGRYHILFRRLPAAQRRAA